ncbi:MAG: hypothetical protein E6R07_01790 [Nevskiaceae bacterium]|nr:MAG: hypothetical protein E6R07_01790 [Nevskiaceae bacterium]
MSKIRWIVAPLLVLAAAGAWWLRPSGGASGPSIKDVAQAAGARAAALTAKSIATEDLPPEGTRSLFDHLIAQNDVLPYPFDKLVDLVAKQSPDGQRPLTLLIPKGRSLLKAQADYQHPRLLMAADFQAPNTGAALGLAPRGQLFLGFVENAGEIEVISYNEAAGRFEFQLVQDYREGGVPRIVYARRAICTTCHQAGAPIFPQRPWNETNGQPETAAKIREARGSDAPYLGVPIGNPLAVPERFDELAEIGNFLVATQKIWIDACADDDACRRQMLKIALRYLWNPAEFDAAQPDAQALRALQAKHWPADGVAVGQKTLPNRDPLAESRGIKGWFHDLLTPQSTEPGARSNEDLDAFERLPKLPAHLDPLTPRPPLRVLSAQDIDGAFGLASMITDPDFKQLEAAAGFKLDTLLAAVDRTDAALFAQQPFSRVKMMKGLLAALGAKADLGYCCLDTKELSPPVALGVPPLAISAGSPLKNFEHYCFACHRGNPSKRLNFMAGATETETLANLKAKTEIRDALDWDRYRGTDKANKLMPPADSHQRQMLEADAAKNPKLLDDMRSTVPALFDF